MIPKFIPASSSTFKTRLCLVYCLLLLAGVYIRLLLHPIIECSCFSSFGCLLTAGLATMYSVLSCIEILSDYNFLDFEIVGGAPTMLY